MSDSDEICEVCGESRCDFVFTDGTKRYGVHFKCGKVLTGIWINSDKVRTVTVSDADIRGEP